MLGMGFKREKRNEVGGLEERTLERRFRENKKQKHWGKWGNDHWVT